MKKKELIIVGGGITGISASISAKRLGIDVLLVERFGFLGGTSTASLVSPFMNYSVNNKPLVQGIFQEILDELEKEGGRKHDSRAFDSETLKYVLFNMLDNNNVEYILHTYLTDVIKENSKIIGIVTESKSGKEILYADFFIDTSADADLCAKAGLNFHIGRESDGLTQAMTLMFRIANVDMKKVLQYCYSDKENFNFIEEDKNGISIAGFKKEIQDERKKGNYKNPLDYIFFVTTHRDDLVIVNTTRILKSSGLNNVDLTKAQSEGTKTAWEIYRLLKNKVSGFQDSYISNTATQVGVRETRRIDGEYTLTGLDVVEAKKFDDKIARGCYPIDIHDPTSNGGEMIRLREGEYYDIPFRCLIPKEIENVLVAGRCISATHEALASVRITPTCSAMGEASGYASALCIKEKIKPSSLEISKLQQLIKHNIYF